MFVLGLLSVLQVTFLPGYLAINLLKIDSGKIRSLVLSFALSLIINHFIVFSLTALHIYNRWSIFFIFISECLLFIYFLKHPLTGKVHVARIRNILFPILPERASVYHIIIYLISAATLLYYTALFINNLGQVFNTHDDVVSWNRWAVDWYQGNFPRKTWHYPQLLPAVWSISYVFLGNSSIQFFAKAIMPLFPLFLLLLMLDLGLRTRQTGYILSTFITGALLYFIMGGPQYLTSGYADVPVTYMAFLSVYLMLDAKYSESSSEIVKKLLIGSVCCGGAALTKQAGLYVAGIYPILSYLLVLRFKSGLKYSNSVIVFVLYSVISACTLPWYLFTQWRIASGLEESEISYVTQGIHNGMSYWERFSDAFVKLEHSFDSLYSIVRWITFDTVYSHVVIILISILMASCLIFSLRDSLCRYIFMLVSVPFYIIWACFYSYDLRNLSLAIPFFGIGLGIGAQNLLDVFSGFVKPKSDSNRMQPMRHIIEEHLQVKPVECIASLRNSGKVLLPYKWWIAISSSLIFLAGLAYYLDDAYLIQRQVILQREIVRPAINRMLYASEASLTDGFIVTDYQVARYLPGFESRAIICDVDDDEDFFRSLKNNNVKYLLISTWKYSQSVASYLNNAFRAGRYQFLGEVDNIILLKVIP